jgi:hypothetical protein
MQKMIGYLFDYIKNKNQLILDGHCEEICSELLTIAEKSSTWIKKDTMLYRCQRGCDLKPLQIGTVGQPKPQDKFSWEPQPFGKERMTPWPDKAKEGRINPKGIPCLYLAKDELTAIQEMQPLPNQLLTIAEFRATKDLRIVDCFGEINDNSNREDWFWTAFGYEFSRPMLNSDDRADYAPTQYLASRFKSVGFHGIAYKSWFNQKLNYAIFRPDDFQFKFESASVKRIVQFPSLSEENIEEMKSNTSVLAEAELYGQVFRLQSNSFLLSGCEFIKESKNKEQEEKRKFV